MKKLISVLLTISIAVAALAQPQGRPRQKGQMPDFEKMKAERVAFITSEVGLTSEDAQAFWPIYNKVEEKQRELNKAEKTAFMELSKALKDGDGNVDALLDAYIKAKQANVNLHFANAKEYKKAIGAEKTAKFFTCDEKFRRQQIGKLSGGHGGPREGFHGAPKEGFKGAPKDGGSKECKGCKDGNQQKSK